MYALKMKGHTFMGDTFPALLSAVESFRDREDMTYHDWPMPSVMRDGKRLGFMSYNGRVWETKAHPSEEVVVG